MPLQRDLAFLQGALLPYSEGNEPKRLYRPDRLRGFGPDLTRCGDVACPVQTVGPGASDQPLRCTRAAPALATQYRDLLAKYQLTATAVEVVGPGPLVWDFLHGPSTIGLVPPKTRAARIDALRQVADFAKLVGIDQVQTHCGFIPEDPSDPLYPQAVDAIRTVAQHCQGNGQQFLMETGQETPTTMARALRDVNMPNLGVGLDTANLILYGKANPVDAVTILGPHIRNMHAKDGLWPTDPDQLGKEVAIGKGLVNFPQVFAGLRRVGYTGPISIEREIAGPQQIEDVRQEKLYLERVLRQGNA
jgi:L-ribulose-5-phosphate 3-epimerase